MPYFILLRTLATARATYGRLSSNDDAQSWRTLELPWLNNHPLTSCIPVGIYTCRRRFSPHNKCEVFEVTGVAGRSDIEIHVANYTRQLLGCIALGTEVFDLDGDGEDDVEHSRVAFDQFMSLNAGIDTLTLDIRDAS